MTTGKDEGMSDTFEIAAELPLNFDCETALGLFGKRVSPDRLACVTITITETMKKRVSIHLMNCGNSSSADFLYGEPKWPDTKTAADEIRKLLRL